MPPDAGAPDPGAFLNAHANDLCVVLLGPGFGESVLLRVPGRDWIVIDGCEQGRVSVPALFLRSIGGTCERVLLTHPHEDHVLGLSAVLSEAPATCVIGCHEPVLAARRAPRSGDPLAQLVEGSRDHVLATLRDRWDTDPARRWDLVSGASAACGDAMLTVLHPPPGAAAPPMHRANEASNAVLIAWHDCRVLKGADLEAPGWDAVAAAHADRDLSAHQALKVPHHGSRGAIHTVWANGARSRTWLITPWNRGRKLPRFEDGEGVEALLRNVDELHLTGLAVAHDQQAAAPCATTRQAVRDGQKPAPKVTSFFPGATIEELEPAPMVAPRCWVAAALGPDGGLRGIAHGPGSVIVRDAPSNEGAR